MKKLLMSAIALWISGCAVESTEDKLAKLESLRKEALAAVARQQGECNAIAIEFNGDKTMVANCQETYRLVVENASNTISDIDKRVAELRRAECALILAKVKKNGGGFVPLDCERPKGSFTYLE